jgi:hypothetical protein
MPEAAGAFVRTETGVKDRGVKYSNGIWNSIGPGGKVDGSVARCHALAKLNPMLMDR